jgi:hypothetical protein
MFENYAKTNSLHGCPLILKGKIQANQEIYSLDSGGVIAVCSGKQKKGISHMKIRFLQKETYLSNNNL